MVKGVEKGYILEIKNFVKFNVHSPLKPAVKQMANHLGQITKVIYKGIEFPPTRN